MGVWGSSCKLPVMGGTESILSIRLARVYLPFSCFCGGASSLSLGMFDRKATTSDILGLQRSFECSSFSSLTPMTGPVLKVEL